MNVGDLGMGGLILDEGTGHGEQILLSDYSLSLTSLLWAHMYGTG